MRLWVTRPEPDASVMAEKLRVRGHEALVAPLLGIELVAGVALPTEGIAAVVATSRNGLRAVADRAELRRLLSLPLLAVGEATAACAREIGFLDVIEGEGSAAGLARIVASRTTGATILHLAGEALAHDLKGDLEALGLAVAQPVLYRSVATERLPAEAARALAAGALDGVVLMSPRTAEIYALLVKAAGLAAAAGPLRHFCLSRAVAGRLVDLAPKVILLPGKPTSEELLALVEEVAEQS